MTGFSLGKLLERTVRETLHNNFTVLQMICLPADQYKENLYLIETWMLAQRHTEEVALNLQEMSTFLDSLQQTLQNLAAKRQTQKARLPAQFSFAQELTQVMSLLYFLSSPPFQYRTDESFIHVGSTCSLGRDIFGWGRNIQD